MGLYPLPMTTIQRAFKPMPRTHYKLPRKHREIGAKLMLKIDSRDVAYLFNVDRMTAYTWRRDYVKGRL